MSFALLRTLLWTDPLIVLATALMGSLNLVVALFDKHGDRQFVMAHIWSKMLVCIMGMDVDLSVAMHKAIANTVEYLGRAKGLALLVLDNTAVGDAGVSAVGQLPALKELHLTGTKVTDVGVSAVAAVSSMPGRTPSEVGRMTSTIIGPR